MRCGCRAIWIGVYGFDLETAGMVGAAYSIPGSIFRAFGGVLSDRFGARSVMYSTFGVCRRLHVHPVLSDGRLRLSRYARTDYVLHFHIKHLAGVHCRCFSFSASS